MALYWKADRSKPAYFYYDNRFYDYRGKPVTTWIRFAEDLPPQKVPSQPNLTGYHEIAIPFPVKYAPVVASVPNAEALYLNGGTPIVFPQQNTGFTNWYVKLPIPVINGSMLTFQPGNIQPGLDFSSLNRYPNILLKVIARIPVFYDAGSEVGGTEYLTYDGEPLILTNAPVDAATLSARFPGFQYIYIDDQNQNLVVFNGGIHVLKIQEDGLLTTPQLNPFTSPLARFTGTPQSTENQEYYQLNAHVLQPLFRQGIQTGVGYTRYQTALELAARIERRKAQLTRLAQEYEQSQRTLQAEIEEYNQLRSSLQ